MKVKYYMQGIGIGIIFSAIVFFLFFRNSSITDEEIIKRAQTLGMVMEDEKDIKALDDLIKGKKDKEESNSGSSEKEDGSTQDSSSDQDDNSNKGNKSDQGDNNLKNGDSQGQGDIDANGVDENDETSGNQEGSVEESSQDVSEEQISENGNQADEEAKTSGLIEIEIEKGMSAEQIARKLEKNGIIKDYQDFKQYLKEKGYTKNISYGTFHMEEDISYEKIVKMLVFE